MRRKQRNDGGSKAPGRAGYRENQERGQDFWNKEKNESELSQKGRGQYEQGQQGSVEQTIQQDDGQPIEAPPKENDEKQEALGKSITPVGRKKVRQ